MPRPCVKMSCGVIRARRPRGERPLLGAGRAGAFSGERRGAPGYRDGHRRDERPPSGLTPNNVWTT